MNCSRKDQILFNNGSVRKGTLAVRAIGNHHLAPDDNPFSKYHIALYFKGEAVKQRWSPLWKAGLQLVDFLVVLTVKRFTSGPRLLWGFWITS